ncbi:DUF3597 domain-containing protein [Aestuariicella sp. G3-2]|uniref:DUF3597 domain-containing protein n=1 Tax=Pseudomaricurvus albidus TaxID=2842452 RepID=UPI001C0E0C23|nr:DUF3597 domain-containing protein [Aestuariicella albida]MBU3069041.1 DUF3597 domain-containing protein [Aestuariicella albida]
MGMFSSIMEKLGFGKDDANAPKDETVSATSDTDSAADQPQLEPGLTNPETMKMVDVVAKLETMAKANPENLNWKTSIVDLLKLLNLDSSYGARKELATELNCPADKMEESAQMNMWLHKTVLQKLADNGGNIPADLLD